jgi:hypothetical protein
MANATKVKQQSAAVDERIPEVLRSEMIISAMLTNYLRYTDEIAQYNADVLKRTDGEWTPNKLLAKAKEWARPIQGDPDSDALAVVQALEKAQSTLNAARQQVVKFTADKMGVSLSNVTERDSEREVPLKQNRIKAVEISKQMDAFRQNVEDTDAGSALGQFLKDFPVPQVGREGKFDPTDTATGAPKYRVRVEVFRGDERLLSENGFTKTALALPKYHARGQAPKSDKLREVWEAAGNTSDNVVQPVVQWENAGLRYVITNTGSGTKS